MFAAVTLSPNQKTEVRAGEAVVLSGYHIAKIEVDMVRLSRFIIAALIVLGLSAVPSRAQAARGEGGGIDYTAVSREMRGFEAVVNKALI